MEFIYLILATFLAWEIVKMFTPTIIPPRLQPFILGGISYGMYFIKYQPALIAMAIAGAVAIIQAFAGQIQNPIKLTRNKRAGLPQELPGTRPGKQEIVIPQL